MPKTKPKTGRRARVKPSHAAFARDLSALMLRDATEDDEATSSLTGCILFDMSSEVGVYVDHPALAHSFILAALAALDSDQLDDHARDHAEAHLAIVRELVAGCTDERFAEIYANYHTQYGEPSEEWKAAQPVLEESLAANDFPSHSILKGDIVVATKSPVAYGVLALVKVPSEDWQTVAEVHLVDPTHVRLGPDADDIYLLSDVEIFGPVTSVRRTVATVVGSDEWPSVIGGGPDAS